MREKTIDCILTRPTPWRPTLILSKDLETGAVAIGDGKTEIFLDAGSVKELFRFLKAMNVDRCEDMS